MIHFCPVHFQIEWACALNSRIRFLRLFYQLFMTLKKESVPVGDGIGECYNLLTTCMEILPSLLKTTYSKESTAGSASSSTECESRIRTQFEYSKWVMRDFLDERIPYNITRECVERTPIELSSSVMS